MNDAERRSRIRLAREQLIRVAAKPLSVYSLVGLRIVTAIISLGIISSLLAVLANTCAQKLQAIVAKQSLLYQILASAILACFGVLAASTAGDSASGVFGGGVPEVRALYTGGLRGRNNQRDKNEEEDRIALSHEFLSWRTLIAKWFSLIFAIGASLPVGREGPFIHISSCAMATLLANMFGSLADKRPLRAQFLLCAVAAGVTNAYGTPIGACLYALEVIATDAIVSAFGKLLATATCALLFARLILYRSDMSLDLVQLNNKVATEHTFLRCACQAAVVTGITGGLVGVLFIYINAKARLFLWSKNATRIYSFRRLIVAAAVASIVAAWPVLLEFIFIGLHGLVHWISCLFTSSQQQQEQLYQDRVIMLIKARGILGLKSDQAFKSLLRSSSFDDLLTQHDLRQVAQPLRLAVYLSLAIRELLLAPLALALPLTAGCVKPLYVLGSFTGAGVQMLLNASGLSESIMPLGFIAFISAAATCASVTALSSAIVLLEMTQSSRNSELVLSTLLAAFVARITAYVVAGKEANFYDVQADRKNYRALPRVSYDVLACATVADAAAACSSIEVLGVKARAIDLERILKNIPNELDSIPVVHDRIFLGAIPIDYVKQLLNKTGQEQIISQTNKHTIPAPAFHVVSNQSLENEIDNLVFDYRKHAHLIRNACVNSVADTMPCSDLFAYLQRADYAFVLANDRSFIGVLTRDAFVALAEAKVIPTLLPNIPDASQFELGGCSTRIV
eukprot:CAMPEP_0197322072 /NCGR_PEP_ID=MMETSP0891-20130614/68036_1 /TAXON_ID=44058 ORGANISM="Aureoumbra lagunensis, Strain CCMP1510" /NCGR_SAMPLE_ID=MMETSP0891 /ASSEMBLY_ACC=CAM_ASM_000534 /LENGTH=737 /DNA_ID=CAMNT_0042814285 /DNA_START=48 /DNA_END=2261 /DNA_ORIENTATION=+